MTDLAGAYEAVLAVETVEGAPDVSEPGVRYGVALVEGEDGIASGSVVFVSEGTSQLFIATDSIGLETSFYHTDGQRLDSVEGPSPTEHCVEVGQVFVLDAPAGPLEVRFGPTQSGELTLLLLPVAS